MDEPRFPNAEGEACCCPIVELAVEAQGLDNGVVAGAPLDGQLMEDVDAPVWLCESGGGGNADCNGWAGCSGFENWVDVGVSAPKPERSGVTVLKPDPCCWVFIAPSCPGLGVAVGVDQENVAGCGEPAERLTADADALGGLSSQLGNAPP
jgi:hypothetical protein